MKVAGTGLTRPGPDQDQGAGARRPVLFVRLDATLIEADSTKTGAAGNYRGGFGFHPLTVPRSRLALQIGRLSPCGYVPNDQDCSILCERRHLQSRELVRMFPLRIYTLSRRDLLRGPPGYHRWSRRCHRSPFLTTRALTYATVRLP